MASIEIIKIAQLLKRMEEAMDKATKEAKDDFPRFFQLILLETEPIVVDLASKLPERGINYPTPNELISTARALLWSAWTAWLWTSKSERVKNPDESARNVRPIFDGLIQHFIETGRSIGKNGGRPEDFLQKD